MAQTTQIKQKGAAVLLVASTMIWGAAFVAQNVGARYIGPFTFGAVRFFLGALVLLPLLWLSRRKTRVTPRKTNSAEKAPTAGAYLRSGVLCGGALFLGALFQQLGIMHTTVGKSGFVTALYVVLVPLFAFVLYRRRLRRSVQAAVVLCILGVYFLCVSESFSVNKGDVYNFIGAVFWAVQILAIERFAQGLDGLKFSVVEFMACAAFHGVFALVAERPSLSALAAAVVPLLYAGLLSVGIGFTAQTVCLQVMDPTVASLIMSLEAVFSVLFGFLLLGETLTLRQGGGMALVLAGVVLAQWVPKRLRSQPGKNTPAPRGAAE